MSKEQMVKRGPKGPSKYTEAFIESEADALLEYAKTAEIPFLKDFCWQRGYGSQRISEFMNNAKFSEALNRFKDRLETQLVFGGLTNKLNSYMVMNTLKNVAGWRDKQEVEHSGELTIKDLVSDVEDRQRKTARLALN